MFYLIGILSGLMLAVQNPYNSNFGKQLASPIAGGFMVYVLGTIEFLLVTDHSRQCRWHPITRFWSR